MAAPFSSASARLECVDAHVLGEAAGAAAVGTSQATGRNARQWISLVSADFAAARFATDAVGCNHVGSKQAPSGSATLRASNRSTSSVCSVPDGAGQAVFCRSFAVTVRFDRLIHAPRSVVTPMGH